MLAAHVMGKNRKRTGVGESRIVSDLNSNPKPLTQEIYHAYRTTGESL